MRLRRGDESAGTALVSRRSFESDDGQIPAAGHEVDHQFHVRTARAANWGLRRRTETFARPVGAGFESRLGVGGPSAVVDFIGCSAVERLVRSVGVVPVEIELQLGSHAVPIKGDER